jgi:hypothetical protein
VAGGGYRAERHFILMAVCKGEADMLKAMRDIEIEILLVLNGVGL